VCKHVKENRVVPELLKAATKICGNRELMRAGWADELSAVSVSLIKICGDG
jgi:hypothetical protein